jgi:hypothetical protein
VEDRVLRLAEKMLRRRDGKLARIKPPATASSRPGETILHRAEMNRFSRAPQTEALAWTHRGLHKAGTLTIGVAASRETFARDPGLTSVLA